MVRTSQPVLLPCIEGRKTFATCLIDVSGYKLVVASCGCSKGKSATFFLEGQRKSTMPSNLSGASKVLATLQM